MRMPAMAALMRLASVAAATHRTPIWAISERRLGARPPSPPRRIASEPRFANPVRAKVMIAWVSSVN